MKPTRLVSSITVAVLLSVPLSVCAQFEPRYFPLEPGTSWTYRQDRFPDSKVENRVVGLDDDGFVLYSRRGLVIRLEDAIDIINIDIPDEGVELLYSFGDITWQRHDIDDCNDERLAFVNTENATVETPAGTFTDVLEVEYQPGFCSDAGIVKEWFAPDVGLIKWTEMNFVGPVTYVLEETSTFPEHTRFRRADVNEDDLIDITDAIAILSHLFLGDTGIDCESSADSNDDGTVDVSDPIHLLSFQFLGGDAPPAPFGDCGEDPTADELLCLSYGACEENLTGGALPE